MLKLKKNISDLLNEILALCATVWIFFIVRQVVILATTRAVEPFLVNMDDIVHLFKCWFLWNSMLVKHGQAKPNPSNLVFICQCGFDGICVTPQQALLQTTP